MLIIVLALGMCNGLVGEKVPAGAGLGWDGLTYAAMVRGFGAMVSAGELSGYYSGRVLPSLIVKALITATGRPVTDANIVLFFTVYSVALLVSCCVLWGRIADLYGISVAGRWMGFLGLFVNFQAAKFTLYLPVLTDLSALTAGMLLILFHVEGRRFALAVTAVAGALCWPTIAPCGALLLLFPIRPGSSVANEAPDGPLAFRMPVMVAYAVVALAAVAAYLLLRVTSHAGCRPIRSGLGEFYAAFRDLHAAWSVPADSCAGFRKALTALPSCLGLLIGLAVLLGLPGRGRAWLAELARIRPEPALLAGLVLLVPILVGKVLANPAKPNLSSIPYLASLIVFPADGQFWMPLVGMVVFWGPLVLVAVLAWPRFAATARRLGPGIVLVLASSLPFGLVGEGRLLTAAWPFIVLVTVIMLDETDLPRPFLVALTVTSIAFAQFWLPLNLAPWREADALSAFPKQLLFMHLGPWMSTTTWLVQLGLCLAAGAWLVLAWSRRRAA